MAITMRAVYSRQKVGRGSQCCVKKLFRLAALTVQCAGLTTLESSSASEPGRNTVLQASNGRCGSYPDGSILFHRKRTSRPVKADFLEIK